MKDQLQLVEVGPELTERQRFALDAITKAGDDGLHPNELGAIWHAHHLKHSPDEFCEHCGRDGARLLHELHKKRLVTRVRGAAVAVKEQTAETKRGSSQGREIPF